MTGLRDGGGVFARVLAVAAATSLLSGCTGLLATTSIEPYTKFRDSRDGLELLAEAYCRDKRGAGDRIPVYLFTTDGCSRWPDDGYAACCVVHDIAYWCGGSADDRKEADQWLERCVDERCPGLSGLMYLGVRLGGMPWLPAPWRWGYGWEWPQGYESALPRRSVSAILEGLQVRSQVEQQLQSGSGAR